MTKRPSASDAPELTPDIGRMRLEVNGRVAFEDPTPQQIRQALAGLPGGNGDSFAILGRGGQYFVQTAGSALDGFRVEYRDGSDARHFVASDPLDLNETASMFERYAAGEEGYKSELRWEPLTLPSASEARLLVMRSVRSTSLPPDMTDRMLALVLGVVTLFMVVGIMGQQPNPLPLRLPCWIIGMAIAVVAHFGTTSWNDDLPPSWGALLYVGGMLGPMGGIYLASQAGDALATTVSVDVFLGFLVGAVGMEAAFRLWRLVRPRPA